MRKSCVGLLSVSLLAFTGSAQASGFALGAKVGTLGVGLEGTYSMTPRINLRADINGMTYDQSDSYSGIGYSIDLDVLVGGLLVDVHPFKGGFHVSGGLYANGSELTGQADDQALYNINGVNYPKSAVGTLKADIGFDSVAPYAGVGWGNAVGKNKRLGLNFDLGVLYQGSPDVTLASEGGSLSNDPTFQAELKKEEQNFQDDIDNFKFYPVASFGLSYRF